MSRHYALQSYDNLENHVVFTETFKIISVIMIMNKGQGYRVRLALTKIGVSTNVCIFDITQ